MNKEFAWFLGFLASDGAIVKPSYRSKGDESHIAFIIKDTDEVVLHKIKSILMTKANVRTYPHYKSPQAHIHVYDRKDIQLDYADIKTSVPDVTGYERHFMRGLVDGDGCLHFRKDRKKFRLNFINESEDYVAWFGKTIGNLLRIPEKKPKWKPKDNLYIVEWEGKTARLIAWFLYHGDIDSCVLDRKLDYYRQHVLNKEPVSGTEELLKAIDAQVKNKRCSVKTYAKETLAWCHTLQHLFNVPVTPIPVNKGQTKYYELYIPAG